MALTKYKLGQLIELSEARNSEGKYGIDAVKGISIKKMFIETKADMEGVGLKPYLVVSPNDFAYVTVTSRNGEKITLAHNTTEETFIVSSSYFVFRVCRTDLLNSDWLFMYFNRPEFDRYARFNSWGSARETFSWEDMRDIDIDLPPLSVQEKYVAVYNSVVTNLKAYKRGLDDLKLACDATIEELRRKYKCEKIGPYLRQSDERNDGGKYHGDKVRGLSTTKKLIPTVADLTGVGLDGYKIMRPGSIAYVADTSRRGEKISLGANFTNDTFLVSSISIVFTTVCKSLLPAYLMAYFQRAEFDRYARFNSWGSAREAFSWEDMCDVEIPIVDLKTQQSVVDMFSAYRERKTVCEKLRNQIMGMCPILIKGSLEEGKRM